MKMKSSMRLAAMAIAAVLLLPAACDRRDTEDDTATTPADTELDRPTDAATATPEATDATAEGPAAGSAAGTTATPGSPDQGTPAATATSQADALAMLMAVNEHEISAADQAIRKKVTGDVRQYAEMMRTDHGKNLQETTRLGGAASTATAVTAMREKGENELRTLDAQTGKAYEKAYIDAMVKGHTEALAMIDNTMLPAATDANVRQHFTVTRTAVSRHLDRAKELQGTMGR